jgi:hypothetical protein
VSVTPRPVRISSEVAHLAAERRLGDVEQQRGLAEAAGLGDMHESFYLLEIHGRPSVTMPFCYS